MIRLRTHSPYETEWTELSFDGEEDELACHILCATLLRLEWPLFLCRDEGEFYELGEDEEPSDDN